MFIALSIVNNSMLKGEYINEATKIKVFCIKLKIDRH